MHVSYCCRTNAKLLIVLCATQNTVYKKITDQEQIFHSMNLTANHAYLLCISLTLSGDLSIEGLVLLTNVQFLRV